MRFEGPTDPGRQGEGAAKVPSAQADGPARPPLSLAALLDAVPNLLGLMPGDRAERVRVAGITAHSGAVRPGFCFVAVRGTAADGHAFVEEAVARGAAAVVVDRPEVGEQLARAGRGVAVAVVSDSRLALAWMAAAFYGHPSQELSVIGVTGTVGKTSTALFLRHLLQSAGWPTGAVGSLGIFTATGTTPSPLTTPDPVTLQAALRTMADQGLRFATVEVSSHALLQRRADSLRLAGAVLTDLLPYEHSDVHPTFQHYLEVKARLFELLDPEAILIYNAANPHSSRLGARWPGARRVAYALVDGEGHASDGRSTEIDRAHELSSKEASRGERGHLVGRILSLSLGGSDLVLHGRLDGTSAVMGPVRTALLGPHAAANAVGAAAAALALGIDPDVLIRGLETLRPPRRRMEILYRGDFTVIDDTTGHPASFERLFATLERCGARGIVLVVGVRGRRGIDINERNGRVVAKWSHRLPVEAIFVTDAEEAVDEPNRPRPEERDALLQSMKDARIQPQHFPTLRQAVHHAIDTVRPGGVLVLAGAQALNQAASIVRRALEPQSAE